MAKYHINKNGVPAVCKAKPGNCPLGGDEFHFNSQEDAQEYADRINEGEFGLLSKNTLESIFSRKDFEVLNRLEGSGYKAYFVGGSLRDAILGLPINDVDISTSARPEQTMEVFLDYKTLPIGIEHGTVVVMIDDEPIEITTFRKDGEYSDSRRPDNVEWADNIKEDVDRRDFTINALAYNKKDGLVDYIGGKEDINNKLIRTVGNPNSRFIEDPLRIMRGLRFSSELNFDIEKETKVAILENKGLLKNISIERIQKEFDKLLLGNNCKDVLDKYPEVIEEFIPEIKSMVGFNQDNPHHHLDVWEHSTLVVQNAKNDRAHKLAAVFHDSGKPLTYVYNEKTKRANFIGHAEESVEIAEKALKRMKYDNKTKARVLNIIKDHAFQISTKPYKVKKAIYELGPDRFKDMIDFKKADDKSKNLNYKNDFGKYAVVEKIAKDYLAGSPILSHKDLDIKGEDLVDLGFKGKQIGDALNELSLLTISGFPNNKASQIKYARKNIL